MQIQVSVTNLTFDALLKYVQQCFAIKSGLNGLLDAARQIYAECIEGSPITSILFSALVVIFNLDVFALANKYKMEYQHLDIKVQYSTKRYYLYKNISLF